MGKKVTSPTWSADDIIDPTIMVGSIFAVKESFRGVVPWSWLVLKENGTHSTCVPISQNEEIARSGDLVIDHVGGSVDSMAVGFSNECSLPYDALGKRIGSLAETPYILALRLGCKGVEWLKFPLGDGSLFRFNWVFRAPNGDYREWRKRFREVIALY